MEGGAPSPPRFCAIAGRELARAPAAYAPSSRFRFAVFPRHARGDTPSRFVNQFAKCGGELNPSSNATSLIGTALP